MKYLFLFTILISSGYLYAQTNTDIDKYKDCLLNIQIHYKNKEKDYEEAIKYKGVETIMVQTDKKGKIKSIERGYISTLVKENYKGTFFIQKPNSDNNNIVAEFPLFDGKNYYFYKAECYDAVK